MAVGIVLAVSSLPGCSPAPSAPPVNPPQTSALPSSTPVTSTTVSPTVTPSQTPSAIPSASPSASPKPSPTRSPQPQTDTYATSVTLSGDRVSYTRLRWYWGKAAQARCKRKHIHSEFEWCNAYYYENTHRLGRGTLAPDAEIRLRDDGGKLRSGTAAQLAVSIRSGSWPYYRLWSTRDQIVRLEQVYTP